MAVYLLHATKPLLRTQPGGGTVPVRHYLGYSPDNHLAQRIHTHQEGNSDAKIVTAFRAIGARLLVVRVWPNGTPALERYLKRAGHIAHLCPECTPTRPGKELSPWQQGHPKSSAKNRVHKNGTLYTKQSKPQPPDGPQVSRNAARTAPA